jgi:tRNA modification GTPase
VEEGVCFVSSRTGEGLAELKSEIRRRLMAMRSANGEVLASTAARCHESLRIAGECLDRAQHVAHAGREEVAAAEIRVALDALGRVAGTVYTDDVLDQIFSRFCIGK